jgi:hypothetical protein
MRGPTAGSTAATEVEPRVLPRHSRWRWHWPGARKTDVFHHSSFLCGPPRPAQPSYPLESGEICVSAKADKQLSRLGVFIRVGLIE